MDYQPRPDEVRFLLSDVLQAHAQFAQMPAFSEADPDLMAQVLDEAGKFVAQRVAPLQAVGDSPGCRFEAGSVTTPPGFRQAYQDFWQAGWPALACASEDGGQGLPWVLEGVLYEWLSAANHGWTMAPGLLHGAYETIRHHASEELRRVYLPRVASGQWLATMNLTEPHAGSDLGLVSTRALPAADGSYAISGTKIFISGGEHDLTDNIVHLVLARLPDAPAGTKGLSLFLCPKFLPDAQGEPGVRNAAWCERIEEKMGLHGSPTCVMRFDGATGWLVGEPGRGLAAMFVMMNAARLHVGLQGVGLADAAWQKARAYADERRQSRAPGASSTSLIAEHPAVQRKLDTLRAWTDGLRLLAYRTGIELDIARHHPQPERREQAQRWCTLVTPVLKSMGTEQAFSGASEALQVFGGHGYIREWGIEQIVRDSRVAMIYEGTNEIQGIDLLVRKVLADGGAALSALLVDLRADLDAARAVDARALTRLAELRYLGTRIALAARSQPDLPYWVADDYLRAVGLTLLHWAWARIGAVSETLDAAQALRWQQPQRAFERWIAPELDLRQAIIRRALDQATGTAPDGAAPAMPSPAPATAPGARSTA